MSSPIPFPASYWRSTQNQRMVMAYLRDVMGREIKDLTDDADAQRNGIDFRIVTTNKTVEFKDCDQIHKTGNLCFETTSNTRKGTPGCMLYSQADLLFYYDIIKRKCHIIPIPALRLAIEESGQRRWSAYLITTMMPRNTKIAYATIGLLVPLEFVKRHKVPHYVLDLSAYQQSAA